MITLNLSKSTTKRLKTKTYNTTVESIIENLAAYVLQTQDRTLFSTIKTVGANIMTNCPVHKQGQERKPSMGISVEEGVCNCFTCGYKASLPSMISFVLGYDDNGDRGILWLDKTFEQLVEVVRSGICVVDRTATKEEVVQTFVSEEELDSYRYYHDYMWKRKLTQEVVEKFDIGYDKQTDCLTFPVWDINGNCVFVARRSVKTKYFNYPQGVDKPVYALNYHKNCKSVFVTESMINALTLDTWGYNAVALLGTGTKEQYNILNKTSIRRIYACLDGDTAGYKGAVRLAKNLKNIQVVLVEMPNGKDVNDLTKQQFEALLKVSKII